MDIVCFSHLRWDFVFQRPQHLFTRFAKASRVLYIEEALFDASEDRFDEAIHGNIHVIKMYVCCSSNDSSAIARQKKMINFLLAHYRLKDYMLWYYTPMAIPLANELNPVITIYDCMDELSAFNFAPTGLKELEKILLMQADIVFTGGYSLYHSKKHQHPNVVPFPSSIDKKHFRRARKKLADPSDQRHLTHPRFGFFGVLDERFDISLINEVAEKRPEWNFILVGPIVKIDPATLPKRNNVLCLGGKKYEELPSYLANWDIAMISFALNESTKYISPTKTPEYLAGGKPVISTPIADVVSTYGKLGLVHIAANADEFIRAAEKELMADKRSWLKKVDEYLKPQSWDATVNQMTEFINQAVAAKRIKYAAGKYFIVNDQLSVA